MTTQKSRRGLYILAGLGVGLMMVPSVRKKVLSFIEESNPGLYHNLSGLIEHITAAVEAGTEAVRQYDEKHADRLVKFESDEESPNYIV